MTNQQFEDRMNRLKQGYNQLPDRSSPETIMQHIHKNSKKKKVYKPQWMYAASILLVIGIGSILTINQLNGTDERSMENSAEMSQIAEVQQLPTEDKQAEMSRIAPNEVEANLHSTNDFTPDRPETITKTISIEGMEEQEQYTLYVDQFFRFSTYLPTGFTTEQLSTDKGMTTFIYPSLNGVQFDQTFIQFSEGADLADTTEQVVEDRKAEWEEQGYEFRELDQSERRKIATRQFSFSNTKDGFVGEFLIITHEARTFVVTIQYPIEMGDGLPSRLAVLFGELEWFE